MQRLEQYEIEQRLSTLENWTGDTNAICREVVFTDFKEAMAKMVQIGMIAEKMNHHPEWTNIYNKLSIKLSTHDAGGVTSLDFQLAEKIEAAL